MTIHVECCRTTNEFSQNTPDVFCRCEYLEARRLRNQPKQLRIVESRWVTYQEQREMVAVGP